MIILMCFKIRNYNFDQNCHKGNLPFGEETSSDPDSIMKYLYNNAQWMKTPSRQTSSSIREAHYYDWGILNSSNMHHMKLTKSEELREICSPG